MQKRWSPWLVWGLGAALFFAEYFGRVAPSVMVPELMRDFKVTAFALGGLSAFFYYPYVAMQVPVGMIVDRYGPHRLLTSTAVICAAGCLLFAFASNLYMAQLGRMLMGFGASFAFVGTLKLATHWFLPQRFGLLAGLTQALGMLGACVGQAPMAWCVEQLGWRKTLVLVSISFLFLAVLIGLLVRDRPYNDARQSKHKAVRGSLWSGLQQVLLNPQSWWNALYAGLVYAPMAAFAELWGVSFLTNVYHINTQTAAFGSGLIFIGWGIGGPVIGWLSDRIMRRKPILYGSAITGALIIACVLYIPNLPLPVVFLLLFCYGISNTGVAIAYAISSEINPRPVAGTSMAFANMASVIVGTIFQPLIGWLLDKHAGVTSQVIHLSYNAGDYRFALLLLPICMLLGLIFAKLIKETYCRPVS
jgi:MFS family permease